MDKLPVAMIVDKPARQYVIELRMPYGDELKSMLEKNLDPEQVIVECLGCIHAQVSYRGESGPLPLLFRKRIQELAYTLDDNVRIYVPQHTERPSAIIPPWNPAA